MCTVYSDFSNHYSALQVNENFQFLSFNWDSHKGLSESFDVVKIDPDLNYMVIEHCTDFLFGLFHFNQV
eukprot:CAMPEP_0170491020 /NCGR_PEP_ID=MMETSP0208-20121228/10233_1 /TAXON_ID=197538 /ORGANISM="Strombidium inclinatum, Strain S3" /LENGTH=68 /DNA_ID=CAMNT_0010766523 /DNA_START=201 /DNA_END=407 /DNA_ORIENTATION=+